MSELAGQGRDQGSADPPRSGVANLLRSESVVLFVVLLAPGTFFSILRPDAFPRIANISNMATDASVLLVLAVGSTFVILTGGIDLSVNGVLVFAGVTGADAMLIVGGDGPGVLLLGLLGATLAGVAWASSTACWWPS